jgi:hypothetical protein
MGEADSVRLGQVVSLVAPHRIQLQDDFTGLSRLSPALKRYSIECRESECAAAVEFSLGSPPERWQRSLALTIPAGVVREFLQRLEAVPVTRRRADPRCGLTDYDPEMRVIIEGGEMTLYVETQSQSPDRTPWRIALGQRKAACVIGMGRFSAPRKEPDAYWSHSADIADAVRCLQSHLGEDVYREGAERVSNRYTAPIRRAKPR